MQRADRYERFAPVYDFLSGEHPVYRAGRLRGIRDLQLTPGMTVLDVGCGTGLNFDPIEHEVGPHGRIIGLDNSPAMLTQARHRADRNGWTNVTLIQADATAATPESVSGQGSTNGSAPTRVDAAIATYSLSVMSDPARAWNTIVRFLEPGAQVCVVDMQRPVGLARFLGPLAVLACRLGGADIDAHPWTHLERDGTEVTAASLRGGHVQVRTGFLGVPAR